MSRSEPHSLAQDTSASVGAPDLPELEEAEDRATDVGALPSPHPLDYQDAPTRPNVAEPPLAPRPSLGTRFRAGDLLPGTRYRIRRWVGYGGMGNVFEAVHEDTERRVALKILQEQFISRADVTQGFRTEARVTGRLEASDIKAPNLVEVYDFDILPDGRALVAMEFLDGRELYEEIRNGPLPLPRIVAIGRQIARGLGAAHRAGIIHRDLKPANVMLVRKDGRPDFVKVLDFGVARLSDDSPSRGGGTPMYLAPEVMYGAGDHRADIYALGCLLFELAVGRAPYDGEDRELLEKHRDLPIPRPSNHAQQPIPARFDLLIERCMAKDPAHRAPSMAEVEALLCELQIEQGWTTPWDDLSAPDVEPQRQARIAEALSRPQHPARSGRWPMLLALGGLCLAILTITVVTLVDRDEAVVQTLVNRVEERSVAARAAAARAYFVYPPVEQPQGSTAYREVLALENIDTEAARERGVQLREEFAETLTRLGDRYWKFEEARSFAHEYYAMATLFVPGGRAQERAGVTPIALDRLRKKAQTGSFTPYELESVLPLAALAQPDEAQRDEMLAQARARQTSARSRAHFDRLLEEVAPEVLETSAAVPPSDGTTAPPQPEAPTGDAATDPEANEDEARRADTAEPEADAPVDDAEVEQWLAQAEQAAKSGRITQAERLYNRARGARPRDVHIIERLGDLYFAAARYADALPLRKRAVQLRPRQARLWIALGDAHYKTSGYDDARKAYVEAQRHGSPLAAGRIQKVDAKVGRL